MIILAAIPLEAFILVAALPLNFLLTNCANSYYIYITTETGNQGYVSLLNLSNFDNILITDGLKQFLWNPEYEIELLKTKDKSVVEKNNSFYANYDRWKKYTDWQNEKWYDLYSDATIKSKEEKDRGRIGCL